MKTILLLEDFETNRDRGTTYYQALMRFVEHHWDLDAEINFVGLIEEETDELKKKEKEEQKAFLVRLYKINEDAIKSMCSKEFIEAIKHLIK